MLVGIMDAQDVSSVDLTAWEEDKTLLGRVLYSEHGCLTVVERKCP
jgi:hypothetical protein